MLEPHQQKRVNTFLDPMSDPLGDGYQVLQSLTAIG
jgi:rod shape determining protein RodA